MAASLTLLQITGSTGCILQATLFLERTAFNLEPSRTGPDRLI